MRVERRAGMDGAFRDALDSRAIDPQLNSTMQRLGMRVGDNRMVTQMIQVESNPRAIFQT